MTQSIGKVYLIGAGPGDPGLITVKGLECVQKADVIIYDYLANERLLDHRRPDAELIYVGKQGSRHTLPQDEINALIVKKAREGKYVARLKGGDPFIFGRGGEEAEELADNGVPFEVVPGVTAATAVPTYAGIPLTHREHTASVAFVTGHEDPTKEESRLHWDKLATGIGTLVFFMGMKNLQRIIDNLVGHGRSPETPVALIQWGTRTDQRVVTGTLSDIVPKVKEAKLGPPAIIVVGEVVRLRERGKDIRELKGVMICAVGPRTAEEIEQYGLKADLVPSEYKAEGVLAALGGEKVKGKRFLIPRAKVAREIIPDGLRKLGAEVTVAVAYENVKPAGDVERIKKLFEDRKIAAVTFTSSSTVNNFVEILGQKEYKTVLKGAVIACIGPVTAKTADEYGIKTDIMPKDYTIPALVEAMVEYFKNKQR